MSERLQTMLKIWEEIKACQICDISRFAQNKCFGDGNVSSPIVFVGEAPGMDEDACGKVFVGRAGHLLTTALQAAGFVRDEIFIANILKCHPPKQIDPEPKGNRKPNPDEVFNCTPFLQRQLAVIRPRLVVALGDSAMRGLLDLPKSYRISGLIGKTYPVDSEAMKIVNPKFEVGITYHPQYIGYRQNAEDFEGLWTTYVRSLRDFRSKVA